MKKTFLLLFFLLMSITCLLAQNRLKRKADLLYSRLSYQLAIPYYAHFLKRHQDADATQKLASCYRLTKDYPNAAKWYDKVILLPDHPPIAYLYYGHALLQIGDLENAKEMFGEYAKLVPSDMRGKNFVQAIAQHGNLMRDSAKVKVSQLPFNTKETEFGVFPYKEGIIFASSREAGLPVSHAFDWLDTPFLNLFFTNYKKDSADWTKPVLLGGDVNSRFHESNFTMPTGSSDFIFTRNNYTNKEKGRSQEGIIKLKLYRGKMEGLDTKDIEELPFNSDQYSTTHPSISADGNTLYFVSDMPGGMGGKDIYFCTKQWEDWSEAVNLETINTPGDEVFPYIHSDGTLYFSSDGHPGLGHLDLFRVQLKGDQQVVNLGYPFNTPWDDFAIYLAPDNENGYLSSDREGGAGGDDIYKFVIQRPTLEILVLDSIAQLVVEDAAVSLHDLTDNSQFALRTDENGIASLKTYYEHSFEIWVESKDFDKKLAVFDLDSRNEALVIRKVIAMYSLPPTLTAVVVDSKSREPVQGATVTVTDVNVGTQVIDSTDRRGRSHVDLETLSDYEMDVQKRGYFTHTERFSTTTDPVVGDTMKPISLVPIVFNKAVRLENIHYDYDKWTIRADAYNDLIELSLLMKKNPTLIVELGSHTDSRGSDKYNEALSQKRANAARIFMIDMGIDPSRLKAKGYGEYKLSNCCYDGEPCTEQEHQANRRTEFKIIGTIDGIDMANSTMETHENGVLAPIDCNKGKKPQATVPSGIEIKTNGTTTIPVKPVIIPKRDTFALLETIIPSKPTTVKRDSVARLTPVTFTIPKPDTVARIAPVVPKRDTVVRVTTVAPKRDTVARIMPVAPKRDTVVRVTPVVPKRDTVARVTPVAPKRDTVARMTPVGPIKTTAPKRDTIARVTPTEPTLPIVTNIAEGVGTTPHPTEKNQKDPNKKESPSVTDMLGDSAPVGTKSDNENSRPADQPIGPAIVQDSLTLPNFKIDARPTKIGNAVTYRVQLGAFKEELSPTAKKKLGSLTPYVFSEPDPKGPPRVYIGEYLEVGDVKKALQQVRSHGYPNAIITGFRGGLELSAEEMRLILHEIRRI